MIIHQHPPSQSERSLQNIIFRFSFIIVLFLLFPPSSLFSSPDSYTGRVIDVADGDTLTILTQNNEEKRIRLGGIDCPESSQLHGDKAKQFIASMVLFLI